MYLPMYFLNQSLRSSDLNQRSKEEPKLAIKPAKIPTTITDIIPIPIDFKIENKKSIQIKFKSKSSQLLQYKSFLEEVKNYPNADGIILRFKSGETDQADAIKFK